MKYSNTVMYINVSFCNYNASRNTGQLCKPLTTSNSAVSWLSAPEYTTLFLLNLLSKRWYMLGFP